MLTFSVLLAIIATLAAFTRRFIKTRKAMAGIEGWVRGQDLDGTGRSYINRSIGLVVKPDVITETAVIEYKSGKAYNKPYKSHVLQAGAEMLATGRKEVTLKYSNGVFLVKKDEWLMKEVLETTHKMRRHLSARTAPEGAPSKGKCASCGFTKMCPDAVV